jgi:hypothetical protein
MIMHSTLWRSITAIESTLLQKASSAILYLEVDKGKNGVATRGATHLRHRPEARMECLGVYESSDQCSDVGDQKEKHNCLSRE